jgi:hypothetical protein
METRTALAVPQSALEIPAQYLDAMQREIGPRGFIGRVELVPRPQVITAGRAMEILLYHDNEWVVLPADEVQLSNETAQLVFSRVFLYTFFHPGGIDLELASGTIWWIPRLERFYLTNI